MTLKDEIYSNPNCASAIASKDCQAIADIMSVGRTQPVHKYIGNGTILEVLGLTVGNALLDVINTHPDFKYVKPLVDQGRLRIDISLTQATLQSLVPSVLTQAQADKLKAVGREPVSLTAQEVAEALFDIYGNPK